MGGYQPVFLPMPTWTPFVPGASCLGEIHKITRVGCARPAKLGPQHDPDHDNFLKIIRHHFAAVLETGKPLYQTENVGQLWSSYLNCAPPLERGTRTCNACRSFIQRFGGLVTIHPVTGIQTSALWPSEASYTVPYSYRNAVNALKRTVEARRVSGVFVCSDLILGTPRTGPWTHLAVDFTPPARYVGKVKTADEVTAEKLEDFGMLSRALNQFSINSAKQAVHMLETVGLYRADKVVGLARWFRDLLVAVQPYKVDISRGNNLIWSAVATAPAGFCHVKTSVVGSLLEDIQSGMSSSTVKERFEKKMNPLQYQRPKAPPAAGNIAQAEKLVEKLGIKDSLARRFARLSDVESVWTTRPAARKPAGPYDVFQAAGAATGVFGHIAPKVSPSPPAPKDSNLPVQLMTWSKFQRTVLKTAEEIEFNVPYSNAPFLAHVTAKHPHAPNMLQWNNPVSYYLYAEGSYAKVWNLSPGSWVKVTAAVLRPWLWGSNAGGSTTEHQGQGVTLVLEGCRDIHHVASGGMFPELLKSEYHPVRATLEAHFKTARIEGNTDPDLACGISIASEGKIEVTIRVTANGIRTTYRIDRWD